MTRFAKKVQEKVKLNKSCLILGIDPILESFPDSITKKIIDESSFQEILIDFYF